MSVPGAIVQDTAIDRPIAITDEPEQLNAFLEPGCAATIWRRQPVAAFQNWLDDLDPSVLPQGRVVTKAEAVRSVVAELCDISHMPACTQRDHLIDDIAALADIFTHLMKTPYIRLRLEAVTTNACCKFHIDAITGRLVCTYRGTGTQYGTSLNGNDPSRVFTVPTGAPILLRGTLWPTKARSRVLHRSPPIEGTGETRLILVLDAISDPEEAV